MLKLANAIIFLGSLRLGLSANVKLNLSSSFVLLIQCSLILFSFLNSIDQTIIDCFG